MKIYEDKQAKIKKEEQALEARLKNFQEKKVKASIGIERANQDIEELSKKIDTEEASLVKDRQTLLTIDRKLKSKKEELGKLNNQLKTLEAKKKQENSELDALARKESALKD